MKSDIISVIGGAGVGKTYLSSVIIDVLSIKEYKVGYYKPYLMGATKYDGRIILNDVEIIKKLTNIPIKDINVGYAFKFVLPPYHASIIEETIIEDNKVKDMLEDLSSDYEKLIVECGELYSPTRNRYYYIDMISDIEGSVILVSDINSGTINNILSQTEILQNRKINIEMVVLSQTKEHQEKVAKHYYSYIKEELYPIPVVSIPFMNHENNGSYDMTNIYEEISKIYEYLK